MVSKVRDVLLAALAFGNIVSGDHEAGGFAVLSAEGSNADLGSNRRTALAEEGPLAVPAPHRVRLCGEDRLIELYKSA